MIDLSPEHFALMQKLQDAGLGATSVITIEIGGEVVIDGYHISEATYAFLVGAATAVPALIAEVRRLREAIEAVLNNPTGHYQHHDPLKSAGANCPACMMNLDNRERLRAALAAKEASK